MTKKEIKNIGRIFKIKGYLNIITQLDNLNKQNYEKSTWEDWLDLVVEG